MSVPDILKEKPLVMIDDIVYPLDFEKKVFAIKNTSDVLSLFTREDLVYCVSVISRKGSMEQEAIVNEIGFELKNNLKEMCDRQIVNLNLDDLVFEINKIKKEVESGIPFKTYNSYFTILAIYFSSLKDRSASIDEDIGFRPVQKVSMNSVAFATEEMEHTMYFVSSDSSLLEQPKFNAIIDLARKVGNSKLGKSKKPSKRNPIESRLRHEVFKRDGYKCKECGKGKEQSVLHADHIVPVSQGGSDELSNLQTLCAECNLAKSNKAFESKVGSDQAVCLSPKEIN